MIAALSVEEQVRERLRNDTPYYAERFGRIAAHGRLIPLRGRPAQLRFDALLEEQRRQGHPMRVIALKARKVGISTWTQAKILQRVTQRSHHRALVIAQDSDTAAELFGISETMYAQLPGDAELALKPQIANQRRQKELRFGEQSRVLRQHGQLGLDSSLLVDTAREFEAGRGFTYHSLHCSEVAFWRDIKRKLTALLNTVPEDDPDTLVVLESTGNGYNHFKTLWDQAVSGESEYAAFFSPWFEESRYSRPFIDDQEREDFIVGDGPYGEAEPMLVEEFGLTLEQLNWRRRTISNPKIAGDLRTFQQEYPATADEAFLSTGAQVFSPILVTRTIKQCEETDSQADVGALQATRTFERRSSFGAFAVASEARWTRREPHQPAWRVWAHPDPGKPEENIGPGQYVVAVDPAGDDERLNPDDAGAYHAIEVVDHRTREQVAEYRSRIDPDLIAWEAHLAALYWNRAWLAVEITGGYGLSIIRKIARAYVYPRVYRRKRLEGSLDRDEDRLGWDTTRSSKMVLEDGMREMLREGSHGIKSLELAHEMRTYVKLDARGKTGPEPGYRSDLLLAYMIAQQVAELLPVKPFRKTSEPIMISAHRARNSVTGW